MQAPSKTDYVMAYFARKPSLLCWKSSSKPKKDSVKKMAKQVLFIQGAGEGAYEEDGELVKDHRVSRQFHA
jgi:hypothetical protein